MNTFLHTKFKLNLNRWLNIQSNLIIALSSGQDSLCLLKLLHDCLDKKKYNIEAIYIDHQWKNDSIEHSKHILNIIKRIKIPITIYQIKTSTISENAARKIRYKILIDHAFKKQYATIITGHNKNDQVETFLQNLIRGTSLNGITNLTIHKQISQNLTILRPLLNFTKSEIAWFCRLFYLPVWSDITNYNYYIKRNRIRHELIPYLKNYFNPNIEHIIYNFIELCQHENEYIKENTIKLYIKSMHTKLISLNLTMLKRQHYILQQRVLQLYFYYNFNKQINKNITNTILNLNTNYLKTTLHSFYHSKLLIQYHNGWLYANIKN